MIFFRFVSLKISVFVCLMYFIGVRFNIRSWCYVFFFYALSSCLLVAIMSSVSLEDFLYTRAIWLIEIVVIWESKDGISFLLPLDVYPMFAHFKKMCSNKSRNN